MDEHPALGILIMLLGIRTAGVWVGVWQIHREVRELSLKSNVTLDAVVEILRTLKARP